MKQIQTQRFVRKNKEKLYPAGGHPHQTHTSTHLHIWVTCALTHYFNIRVFGRWSRPFCQGGCLFIGRQKSENCFGWQRLPKYDKRILWNRNVLVNEILVKICRSKINKTITGPSTFNGFVFNKPMVNPFGMIFKTGPITSSKNL